MVRKRIAIGMLALISVVMILFQNCSNQQSEEPSTANLLTLGDSITKLTFDTLSKELMHAMGTEGVEGAIDYCRSKAPSLTSVYERGEVMSITRTALQFRNPGNAPDSLETEVLRNYETNKSKGEPLKSVLIQQDERTHYFKPILLHSTCLSCHGQPHSEIATAVIDHIKEKYPNDNATGFKEGDLRGMWHIVFKN